MKTKIISLAICLFTLVSCSAGKETKPGGEAQPQAGVAQPLPKAEAQPLDPFDKLALETLTYFAPIKGIVNSVNDGVISAPIKESDGAKRGMRLGIFREGEPYYHPITRAEI